MKHLLLILSLFATMTLGTRSAAAEAGPVPAPWPGMQTRIFKYTTEMNDVLARYMPEDAPGAPHLKTEEVLMRVGVTFPEGAGEQAKFHRIGGQVVIRNTPENLDRIKSFLNVLEMEAQGLGKADAFEPRIKNLRHPGSVSLDGLDPRVMPLVLTFLLALGAGVAWLLRRRWLGRAGEAELTSAPVVMLATLATLAFVHSATAASPPPLPSRDPDPAAHTVIVPYDGSKPVAEQKAQRVYLPYDSFQKLWQQAKENRRPELTPPDKQESMILSALHQVRVEERGLVIESKLEAVSRGHWTRLPLPFLSGETALLVGEVQVDGKAAALNEGAVILENPGSHAVHLTATLALPREWRKAELLVPSASGALLAVQTPKSDGWLRINGEPATGAEDKDNARLFTHGLGTQGAIVLERSTRGLNHGEGAVTSAGTSADLILKEHQRDLMKTSILYHFPGSTRRSVSFSMDVSAQQLFTLRALTLESDEDVPLEGIAVSSQGALRRYVVTLAREVTDGVELSLSAHMTGTGQAMTAPQAEAQRVSELLSIHHDQTMEVKTQPTAAQRRVAMQTESGLTAVAYEQGAHAPLAYSVTRRSQLAKAVVDYVFQLSPQKLELIAALSLQRRIGTWTHARLALPPGGYEVQSVAGPAVKAWQHVGTDLFLHLDPALAGQDARLVVHLARTVAQPAATWTLEPLGLTEFEKVTGRVLVTAHAASEVRLPALTAGLKEVDASVLDSVIAIAPPIEKKRAVEFEDNTWKLAVPLTPQPARFIAEGVALVLVSDTGVRLSQQIGVQVTQGALRQAVVRLPATLPEAVVTGPQLRELRSRVEGAVRIYECTFQSDVLDRAELTFDHDLPLGATLAVPFATVDAAERLTRYFVTDNVSAREASVTEKTGIESVSSDAMPYLPANLARPQFYRSTGAGTLRLAFQQLTATEANAALVTLANITSVLRPDGERWDTITYSLLNRTLQFLPVKLSPSSELMSASVNGEPVRADEEKRADGVVKLIPLIQTKPGQRALEVRLVCRYKSSGKAARAAFDDPELPGLSIERTTWTVWTPKGMLIDDFDGNMEEVGSEGLELQKLEGMLSELGDVNRELASGKLSYDDAKDAFTRARTLADQVAAAKQTIVRKAESVSSRLLSSGRYEKKSDNGRDGDLAQDEMDKDVSKQRDLLSKNWGDYEGKAAKPQSKDQPDLRRKTDWSLNKSGAGQLELKGSNTFTGDAVVANGGAAVFNDNVAVNNGFFGNNTYQGQTTVNAGALSVGNTSTTSGTTTISGNVAGSGGIVLNNGQAVEMNGANLINRSARGNSLSRRQVDPPPTPMEHQVSEKKRVIAQTAAPAPAPAAASDTTIPSDPFGTAFERGLGRLAPAPGTTLNWANDDAPRSAPASPSVGRLVPAPSEATVVREFPYPPGGPAMDPFAAPPPVTLGGNLDLQTIPSQPGAAPATPSANAFSNAAEMGEGRPKSAEPQRQGSRELRNGIAAHLYDSTDEMRFDKLGAQTQAQTAEFLRTTGRRSLLVEVPADGEVRHFSKLKDHAVLTVELHTPWRSRTLFQLAALGVALALWALSLRFKKDAASVA